MITDEATLFHAMEQARTFASRAHLVTDRFIEVTSPGDLMRHFVGRDFRVLLDEESGILPNDSRNLAHVVVLTDDNIWCCAKVWHHQPHEAWADTDPSERAVAGSSATWNATVWSATRTGLAVALVDAIQNLTYGPNTGPYVSGLDYLRLTCPPSERDGLESELFLCTLSPAVA